MQMKRILLAILILSRGCTAIPVPAQTAVVPTFNVAQFCLGSKDQGFASELKVDGIIVERRSWDMRHVAYAKGWNRSRVDAVIKLIRDRNNGNVFNPQ